MSDYEEWLDDDEDDDDIDDEDDDESINSSDLKKELPEDVKFKVEHDEDRRVLPLVISPKKEEKRHSHEHSSAKKSKVGATPTKSSTKSNSALEDGNQVRYTIIDLIYYGKTFFFKYFLISKVCLFICSVSWHTFQTSSITFLMRSSENSFVRLKNKHF